MQPVLHSFCHLCHMLVSLYESEHLIKEAPTFQQLSSNFPTVFLAYIYMNTPSCSVSWLQPCISFLFAGVF